MPYDRLERVGFWFDSLESLPEPEPPRPLPAQVDVAIVGGGFTGLWTAYYLKRLDPSLDIAVLEAVTVGFGASGRNGGWCTGMSSGLEEMLERPDQREAGVRLLRALIDAVDEVGQVCQAENIDCHYAKGGALTVAHTPYHTAELQEEVEDYAAFDLEEDYYHWLPQEESRRRVNCSRNYGATYTPHCAAIHPGRLVRGLSEAVQARGVRLFESTPVIAMQGTSVTTPQGRLRADAVILATEGYTDSIAGHKRRLIPLCSMMVATEPLPDGAWDEIGLANRETFTDLRRVTIYGQRTADSRLAFGGAEFYPFGSRSKTFLTADEPGFAGMEASLRTIFPVLENYAFTHHWGGVMGVSRHWRPCVVFDRAAGFGAAGGYVGEGVSAANLAGRILADLMLGRKTDITQLPWVDDVAGRWEPEPLRWLGAATLIQLANWADRAELAHGQPSKFWGGLYSSLMSWTD